MPKSPIEATFRIPAMSMPSSEPISPKNEKDLVILIHGIRTRAYWQNTIRFELEREGFIVEPTNYGRFDLFRFISPIWSFRLAAIEKVRRQIALALRKHKPRSVSFVAHSFGTFILGHILLGALGLRPKRIILCGCILPYDFRFDDLIEETEILSEAGRRDYWPALAESVTWGYGSAGTYGFNNATVRDRFHNELGHSDFLKIEFCNKFWIPFLKNGSVVSGNTDPQNPPWYMQLVLLLAKKYLIITAFTIISIWLFLLRAEPIMVELQRSPLGFTFVGNEVVQLVESIEHDSTSCMSSQISEIVRGRRCVSVDRKESDMLARLVTCGVTESNRTLTDRDPSVLLEKFTKLAPCIRLDGIATRRLSISVDTNFTQSWTDSRGRQYLFCECSDSVMEAFKRRYADIQ